MSDSGGSPFFADPYYVRRNGNVNRSKQALRFALTLNSVAILVIAVVSGFNVTISVTYSLLALFHAAHWVLAIWAFFVARPATFDTRVTVTFAVAVIVQLLLDVGALTWRYLLVESCRNDATPTDDCNDHFIPSAYVLLPLNWLLVGSDIVFLVTAILIATLQPKVIRRIGRALEVARIKSESAGAPPQPVIVQVVQTKKGTRVASDQGVKLE